MMATNKLEDYPDVAAAVLFGSHARGDCDRYSDIDLAVFVKATSPARLRELKSKVLQGCGKERLGLSVYSTSTAGRMAEDGSLFLWHLKLEGEVLLDRTGWFEKLLAGLSTYSPAKAKRDLRTFEQVLRDCGDALSQFKDTSMFEVATTFSILRNLGIIHSYVSGEPDFGRTRVIFRLAERMGGEFPFTLDELHFLEECRLSYMRATDTELPLVSREAALKYLEKTIIILKFVQGVC